MDAATKSLNHIFNSGEYSVKKDIPVFDAHDEFDADGKLTRRFGRKELQKIVDTCNKRAEETGTLSPFGPGHTITDAPEHLQPFTYGYVNNYRVGEYGPGKKLGILGDFHIRKKVTTPDRKEVDGVKEFLLYDHRSIELWLRDGFIDRVALLRRTPQRDLGLVVFEKGQQITVPSTGNIFSTAQRNHSYAAAVRGGKLCYAMEPDMPMDIPPPAAGAPSGGNTFIPGQDGEDDADYQQFCRNCDRYMKEHFGDNLAKYQIAPTAPAGDDAVPPDPTLPPVADDNEVRKMAREYASADPKVQVAMFQRMANYVASVNQRVAAVETSAKEQALQFSKEDAANRVAMLVGEGFVMDANEEQKEFEELPLGAPRDKKMTKVRTRYQRDAFSAAPPITGAMLNTGPNGNGAPKQFSRKEDADKVVAHAEATGKDYAAARRELFPDK